MKKLEHVVIMGGGFGGLLSAALCAAYAEKVTIIERYPQHSLNTEIRRGIPQAHHLHVLLKKGQEIIEQIFPGILEALEAQGAMPVDWSQDTYWQGPFGLYPNYHSNVITLLFSRALLDRLMYQRIAQMKNITIIQGTLKDIQWDQPSNCICRVDYHESNSNQNKSLEANFFIDARGKSSNISKMLNNIFQQSIPSKILKNKYSYLSFWLKINPVLKLRYKQYYLQKRPGSLDLGAVFSPIENNRFIATFIGWKQTWDRSATQAHFLDLLKNLGQEELYEVLSQAFFVSKPQIAPCLDNIRHIFSKSSEWPSNLLVVGDAVCRLNPVYGQGMTVCAKQILLLKALMNKLSEETRGSRKNWCFYYQKKLDKQLLIPWVFATSEDRRGQKNIFCPLRYRVLHYFIDRLLKAATKSPVVHQTFLNVLHMLSSPLQLLSWKFFYDWSP